MITDSPPFLRSSKQGQWSMHWRAWRGIVRFAQTWDNSGMGSEKKVTPKGECGVGKH